MALASRLKMTPSEFRLKANRRDLIELLALDRVNNEEWRKAEEEARELKESEELSPEDYALRFKQMFGGNNG